MSRPVDTSTLARPAVGPRGRAPTAGPRPTKGTGTATWADVQRPGGTGNAFSAGGRLPIEGWVGGTVDRTSDQPIHPGGGRPVKLNPR